MIETVGKLCDETSNVWGHRSYCADQNLTRADHPKVNVIKADNGETEAHHIAVTAPSPTFFDAMIRGLLADIGVNYLPRGHELVELSEPHFLLPIPALEPRHRADAPRRSCFSLDDLDDDFDNAHEFAEPEPLTPEELEARKASNAAWLAEMDAEQEAKDAHLAAEAEAEARYLAKLREASEALNLSAQGLPAS